jgi:2-phospho-L-lactate guanylyltransferase
LKIAALVPFKSLTRAKRRLRTRLRDEQVERISRAMLADVLDALRAAPSLAQIAVLTEDAAVAEIAESSGASVRIQRPDPGLNPTLESAGAELVRGGFDASLVVLGDLPLLQGEHIEAVLAAGAGHDAVLVPSSDGGTALLLRRPPDCFPSRFGKDSAAVHTAEARSAGLDLLCFTDLPEEVRVDLDTPDDIVRVARSAHACRTRDLLRELEMQRGPEGEHEE